MSFCATSALGGVAMTAFFQMDKATGGLKRVQFERQPHGVNPPSYRAVVRRARRRLRAAERDLRDSCRPG